MVGRACTAIFVPSPVVRYPEYSVLPIYIGYDTNCVLTPLIVMAVVLSTAAKLVAVI